MAETSFALTKYIPFPPAGEMPHFCTPNTKYKTKVKQVLRDIMKHIRGLREGFNSSTDEKVSAVTLSSMREPPSGSRTQAKL